MLRSDCKKNIKFFAVYGCAFKFCDGDACRNKSFSLICSIRCNKRKTRIPAIIQISSFGLPFFNKERKFFAKGRFEYKPLHMSRFFLQLKPKEFPKFRRSVQIIAYHA